MCCVMSRFSRLPPHHLYASNDGVGGSDGGDDVASDPLGVVEGLRWSKVSQLGS